MKKSVSFSTQNASAERLKYILSIHLFFILISLSTCIRAVAQEVEHNYAVGPQTTNCDSLRFSDKDQKKAIYSIRASKFRFDQSFKLTRKQGLQRGEFYTCNGILGFLIITYDGKEILYLSVEKSTWNDIISASDPEGYYIQIKPQLKEFP